MPTGARAAAETVLQGGFKSGQIAILEHKAVGSEKDKEVQIKVWIANEGKWEVIPRGSRVPIKVKPQLLRLKTESNKIEKIKVEARDTGKDRPCSGSLSVGDLVQFKLGDVWEDASVAELIDPVPGNPRQVKIVSLADCTQKIVPLSGLRQKENFMINRRRLKACSIAREKVQKKKVTTNDVLEVLRLWAFAPNDVRKNVIPEGKSFVFSDTLGLVSRRTNPKECCESQLSRDHPELMRLMCRWLKDNAPDEYEQEFPFTSINLNFAYNARLHRDSRNVGPSLLRAIGKFKGGRLFYYPDDDKTHNVEQLKSLSSKHRVSFNISNNFHLIDGNRAHGVEEFSGERFSVVFFSCGSYRAASKQLVRSIVKCGATWPTSSSMAYFKEKLPPPKGYGILKSRPHSSGRGQKRKAENSPPEADKRNTVGTMYKLIDFPHLHLQLTLGKTYSTASLVKRCHGDVGKLTALRRKLEDESVFEPIGN